MHIKRFVARDMKHAIRLVRDEQGPDAVILSNQRVPGGIEIIAAVDYDPRLIDHALGAATEGGDAEVASSAAAEAAPQASEEPDGTPSKAARRSEGKTLRLPSPRDQASAQSATAQEQAPTASSRPSATDEKTPASTRRTRRSAGATRKPATAGKSTAKRRSSAKSAERRPAKRAKASATRSTDTRTATPFDEAAADTEILLPTSSAPTKPIPPVRHGGRDSVELAPASPRRDAADGPRPVSMTLWREGPEATVELSLVGEEDTRRQDLVDWEPPAQHLDDAADHAYDDHDAEHAIMLETSDETPESFEEAMSAQQLNAGHLSGNGSSAPAFTRPKLTGITRQRYAEIEDYPDPAQDTKATDEADSLGDERVKLSFSLSENTPEPAPAKGNGLLGVLAGVTRRQERPRTRERDSLAAGAEGARQRTLRLYLRSLHRVGLSDPLVQELASAAGAGAEPVDWPALAGQASARLRTLDQEVIDRGGVVALVGPTGVGKTTSIAKLAARFALKHGRERLALITTDTFRVGAHEQLNTFARILGVPLFQADDPKTFSALMRRLSRHRLVLIDTAGMGQRDLRLAEELSLLSRSRANVQVLLTLCANTDRRTMLDTIERFAEVKPAGCVLTKMDEARAPGTALGALIETGLPLAYTSNGQNVPEDLHWARSKRLSLVQQVFHQADMECRDQIDDADEVRESA